MHVQSPCTTYNDTFDALKGNVRKGIDPTLFTVSDEHDPSDRAAAYNLLQQDGIPVGVVYHDKTRPSLDQQVENTWTKTSEKTVQDLMDAFEF